MTYGESVNEPPTTGPTTDDTPNAIPKNDVYRGLLRSGTSRTMIMIAPHPIPAAPIPAMARPTMTDEVSKLLITFPRREHLRAELLGAAPHSALPASKSTVDARNVHFVSYS